MGKVCNSVFLFAVISIVPIYAGGSLTLQGHPGSDGGQSQSGSTAPENKPGTEGGVNRTGRDAGRNPGDEGGVSKPSASGFKVGFSNENPLTVLNTGTEGGLTSILKISSQDAQRIIQGRPYSDISELKKILSKRSYSRLSKQIEKKQKTNK